MLGWATESASEEEAAQRALSMCDAAGALECELIRTFAKVDVASGQLVTIDVTSGTSNLRKLRQAALKQCGPDCAIVRDGCALPAG